MNMARAQILGWGVQVSYQDISEETLSQAMHEVLSNQIYTDNIKLISKRLKDQPQQPMEKAIYWIEYVLRNDGAHYMQSSAQYLNFIEYYNLDIYLLFAMIIFIVTLLPVFAFRKVKKCFMRKTIKKAKKN